MSLFLSGTFGAPKLLIKVRKVSNRLQFYTNWTPKVFSMDLWKNQKEVDLKLECYFVAQSLIHLVNCLRDAYFGESREAKLYVLREVIHQILQPLKFSSHWQLPVHISERLWCSQHLVALVCRYTTKVKGMLFVGYVCSFIRWLTGKYDIAMLHGCALWTPCQIKCTYDASKIILMQLGYLIQKVIERTIT